MTESPTSWQATVELPVGLGGDDGAPSQRLATIRKMTGNEEALLADPKLRGNGGKLITALLASCVTTMGDRKPGAEVIRRLSSADRNFLLLEIRRLTFGDEMEARYRCPRCQNMTAVIEDLATIEVRVIDDDEAEQAIEVTLNDGYRDSEGNWQRAFAFRLPTGEDEEASGSRKDVNPARQRDALLARCLLRVGDIDPRKVAATGVRILADLSLGDRRVIQKAMDDAAPGPDLTRTISCDQCGDEFRTTLDMSHFFPSG